MKQKSLSWYKKKLWSIFTAYVKKRDKNICFTCGKYCEGKNAHGGHFIKASVCGIELYFHEDNVHTQCYYCNIRLDGNQYEYGIRLGKKCTTKLEKLRIATKGRVWERKIFESKIDFYKQQLTNL